MKTQFYPVVHAHGFNHGIDQANAAIDAGAKNIVLIDQFCNIDSIYHIANQIRSEHADVGIVINSLHQLDNAIFDWINQLRCDLWTDSVDFIGYRINCMLSNRGIRGLHFGGVCFKYNRESDFEVGRRLGAAAAVESPHFIVTTSGTGTGLAPTIEKIKRFRSILRPTQRLAIASGITGQNVFKFMPYATDFFVGTYIEDDNHCIIPERVNEMVQLIDKNPQ